MADDMQVNVDVKGWITGILKHCPECGSTNLATHEEEEKVKHRCLDCLAFFAETSLKNEKSSGD